MALLGFILAVLSAVFNGSFAALSKLPQVQRAGTEPVVFNLYVCLGVFVSGLCSIPFFHLDDKEVGFPIAGMVAGMLFVLAGLFSFLAIPELGLAVGQGVWGGSAVLVAFLWGVVGPEKVSAPVDSVGLSVVAVVLLLASIAAIIQSMRISDAANMGNTSAAEKEPLHQGGPGESSAAKAGRQPRPALGLIYAALVGIFGGSILVPLKYVSEPEKYGNIGILLSFGTGCLLFGCIVTAGFYAIKEKRVPDFHVKASLLPGVAAGFVWNFGNVCSIYAMSEGLSYGVAYPIMQCALLVSGLWGVLVFKEITGFKAKLLFFSAGGVLLGGAAMLSVFGPKPEEAHNATTTATALAL